MIKKGTLDLWIQIQSGDKSAFDRVYHMHIDALYNYGYSLSIDKQSVEDAIQEMFILLWTRRASISIQSSIKSYLMTTLRRLIIAQIKKQHKTILKSDLEFNSIYSESFVNFTDYRIALIKREISNLSRREREAIVLKYQEGMSYDDMSDLMNLKSHAIYKLVSRGLQKIKTNIKTSLTQVL